MKVEANKVVSFHYSVSDGGGEPVDSSRERGEPLAVLIGAQNIIPGLEAAMLGREAGERFQVEVAPAEAYGSAARTSCSACRRSISRARRSSFPA